MTKADKAREKILKMRFRQMDHAARQMEARENKTKHNLTRMQWIARQNNANYRNELDRIRGELSRSKLGDHTKERLARREQELEALFSQGKIEDHQDASKIRIRRTEATSKVR